MKIIRMRFQATQAFMLLLAITAAFLTTLLPVNGQTALTESTRIQTNGMMPIEIGMTVKQAEGVSGTRLIGGVVINQCYYVTPQNGSSGVAFMVKNGRIARVDVRQNQRILTRRGAKIGDTKERLKQLYGTQINNSAASGRSMKQPLFSTSYAPRDGESTLDEIDELCAVTAGCCPSIKVNHPLVELRITRSIVRPPIGQTIDDKITSFSRLPHVDCELVGVSVENSKGHQDGLPLQIVVISLLRIDCPGFATS